MKPFCLMPGGSDLTAMAINTALSPERTRFIIMILSRPQMKAPVGCMNPAGPKSKTNAPFKKP
jgi:hypothetical protein